MLAELRGVKSPHYDDYRKTGVADAQWEASLRADWPGKKDVLRLLMHEWNRYPFKCLADAPADTSGMPGKPACAVSFEGASVGLCYLSITPGRMNGAPGGESFLINSLPPWWLVPSEYRAVPRRASQRSLEPTEKAIAWTTAKDY